MYADCSNPYIRRRNRLYENALYKIGLKVVARRILWLQEKDNEGYYEKKDLESYREIIDNELKKIY